MPIPRRRTRSALLLGVASFAAWTALAAARPAPARAQNPSAAAVQADLANVQRFIQLIDEKKLFIQKEGEGFGMATFEQVDADLQAQEVDLELDDSPQAREAAARAHAENLQNEVNRRYAKSLEYLPLLESQRQDLEDQLAKLGGAPQLGGAPPPPEVPPAIVWPDPMDWTRVRGQIRMDGSVNCFNEHGTLPVIFSRWTFSFVGDGTVRGQVQFVKGEFIVEGLYPPQSFDGRITDKVDHGYAEGRMVSSLDPAGTYAWSLALQRPSGMNIMRPFEGNPGFRTSLVLHPSGNVQCGPLSFSQLD